MICELVASYGTSDGAVLGIEVGTEDGIADDGAVFDVELVGDDGSSDDALLGHATVVVLLGSADIANTASAGVSAAADDDGI